MESIMEGLRIIVEPTNQQVTIDLPPEMNSKRVEIIVLPAGNDSPSTQQETRRKPSPMLAGTVIFSDDLIAPPVAEEDWDSWK